MQIKKILYLVHAEKYGEKCWKIGFTSFSDPLQVDKKHFLECYRRISLSAIPAKEISSAIYLNINNLIKACEADGFMLAKPSIGFSYEIPLEVIRGIFDFWVDVYTSPSLWMKCIGLLKCHKDINFSTLPSSKGLIGSSAKWEKKIQILHSFRPTLYKSARTTLKPMW